MKILVLRFQRSPSNTDRAVSEGIPCIVDPDPPSCKGFIFGMRDDMRCVGRPLIDLVDKVDRKVVVKR